MGRTPPAQHHGEIFPATLRSLLGKGTDGCCHPCYNTGKLFTAPWEVSRVRAGFHASHSSVSTPANPHQTRSAGLCAPRHFTQSMTAPGVPSNHSSNKPFPPGLIPAWGHSQPAMELFCLDETMGCCLGLGQEDTVFKLHRGGLVWTLGISSWKW